MWTILTWINVTNVKFQSEIEQYCQSNKSPCSQKDKRENNPYRPKKNPQIKILVIAIHPEKDTSQNMFRILPQIGNL